MDFFLIPHHPTQSSILLWAAHWAPGGVRPQLELVIYIDRTEFTRRALSGTWHALGRHQGTTGFRFRAEAFGPLPANTRFRAALVETRSGVEVANCLFDTLPIALRRTLDTNSTPEARPFTMMLGSCYWDEADNGDVADAYRKVLAYGAYSPHLKMLVGDQVYIDQSPGSWHDPTMGVGDIRERVTSRYLSVWRKLGPLLKGGANICSTDDHDFWNDFPFRPLRIWVALQDASVRRRLAGEAGNFARQMQRADATHRIDIGTDLSVFVLDTRINRTETQFCRPADLAAVERWIAGLSCPGVLVVGQPVLGSIVGRVDLDTGNVWKALATVAGGLAGGVPGALIGLFGIDLAEDAAEAVVGEISDHNLPYFKAQYRRLTQALARAPHDMLVLSGDIHLGRIARTKVHHEDGRDPTRIHEVIASPLTMLDTGPVTTQETRNSQTHPRHFPVDLSLTAPGSAPGMVDYVKHLAARSGDRTPDHFMTLSFTSADEPGSVRVSVRAWQPRSAGTARLPNRAWTYSFNLDEGRLPVAGPPPNRAVLSVMTDADGDILALCNPLESWSPRLRHEIIADIESGRARYHVAGYPGQQPGATIHVVRDRVRNIAYLRTNPDEVGVNNLDNLPRLTPSEWH